MAFLSLRSDASHLLSSRASCFIAFFTKEKSQKITFLAQSLRRRLFTHAKKKSVIILLHSRAPCSPRSIEYMLALHNTRKKRQRELNKLLFLRWLDSLLSSALFISLSSCPTQFTPWFFFTETSLFFRHSIPLSSHPIGPRSMEWNSLFSLFLTPMLPHFGNNGLSKWWFFETFFKLKLQTSNAHDTHFKAVVVRL